MVTKSVKKKKKEAKKEKQQQEEEEEEAADMPSVQIKPEPEEMECTVRKGAWR